MNGSGQIERHRSAIAGLLVVLGAPQALLGLWALLAPHSFYKDFGLGGKGWVATLGAYDEHLVRDVGSLFLGLGVLMMIAAVRSERTLSTVAAVVWLIFAIPHAIYHFFNLGPYATGDAIANVTVLVWTVVGGVLVLVLLRDEARVSGRAPY